QRSKAGPCLPCGSMNCSRRCWCWQSWSSGFATLLKLQKRRCSNHESIPSQSVERDRGKDSRHGGRQYRHRRSHYHARRRDHSAVLSVARRGAGADKAWRAASELSSTYTKGGAATMSQPLPNLLSEPVEKIRATVDANTVIGEAITTPDGVTILPVSRIKFG